MALPRIIATVLYRDGLIVRSQGFKRYLPVGTTDEVVERYKQWDLDELVLLNISTQSAEVHFDEFCTFVKKCSDFCFTPMAVGGKISSMTQVEQLLKAGADRIVLGTVCYENPNVIRMISSSLGAQAIVAAVDVKKDKGGTYKLFSHNGKIARQESLVNWLEQLQDIGAGEIFLNNIERDGYAQGYDHDLLKQVRAHTKLPLVAAGGAGSYQDFVNAIGGASVDAVAAGCLFMFRELSYFEAKEYVSSAGIVVRPGHLGRDYRAMNAASKHQSSRLGAEHEKIWQELADQEFDV